MRSWCDRSTRAGCPTWRILLSDGGSAVRCSAKYALELIKLARGGIGDRPKGEVAFGPVAQAVAPAARGRTEVGVGGRQYEQVDHVLAPFVYQCRHRLSRDQVETAANQRKSLRTQIDGRRRHLAAPGEPRLHRVPIRGCDVGQVGAEQ